MSQLQMIAYGVCVYILGVLPHGQRMVAGDRDHGANFQQAADVYMMCTLHIIPNVT